MRSLSSPAPRSALRVVVLLSFWFAAASAWAQTGVVRGVVIDGATSDPLIGAAVLVQGTSTGASTDVAGAYEFEVAPGTYVIEATYIGYAPETREVVVRAGLDVEANFGLSPDLTGLDEVVVTGALSERSVSRSEVAVSRIDAAELTDAVSYQDVSQLLNGKVAGVSVQPSSGNVGGGIRFNVRSGGGFNGTGQPLIFIDGVRVDNTEIGDNAVDGGFSVGGQGVGALADLNPQDIAAVDVLKGPAASALYGTDASNGVVLITTKGGAFGGRAGAPPPFQVSYSTTLGTNSQQFSYDEATAGATSENANAIFRDGDIRQHTLGVSGGSSTVRYFVQGDLRDEDGIVFQNYQDRRSLRANFEAFPLPTLTLGVNGSFGFNTIGLPQNDNNILGYLGNTLLFTRPYAFTDSVSVRSLETEFRTNRFLGSIDARYEPFPGFALKATLGLDATDTRQDQTRPSNLVYSGVTSGERSVFNRENDQVSFQLDGRYRYEPVAGLDASTSVGVQGFDRRVRTVFFQVQNFATPLITNVGAGSDYQFSGEFFNNVRQVGLIAEQSFDYADTYFLTAGLRNDYASAIGVEAPSIVYPMVRGAVRLDRFGAVPSAFTLLKARAAFGESGQLPDSFDGVPILYSAEVGGDGAGAVPQSIGNAAIVPERVGEVEVGLDAELFDRVGLQTTYYWQSARNSIFDVPLVPSSGLVASNRPTNVGRVSGEGFELSLDVTPLATRNASVTLGAIVNYATNAVDEIGFNEAGEPLPALFDGFDVNVIKPGLPRAALYVRPVVGALFDDGGAYAGVDVGVDPSVHAGEIAAGTCSVEDDRCLFGTPYPEWNGSFTASATLFRDLTVYALADWATGLTLYNQTADFQAQFGNYTPRNELADQLGLTTTEDPDTGEIDEGDFPDLEVGTEAYREAADAYAKTTGDLEANFIRAADFLKLREISVRYDLGRLIAAASGFSRIRTASVGLSARNLWTSTLYDGLDPEVNFDGSRSLTRGQDFLTLQNPRTVSVTLRVGL